MVLLDEEAARRQIEAVSKFCDKNQKLAWRRKMVKMTDLLEEIEPLNEEMLALILRKQPIMDKIEDMRQVMVKECVHPADYLVHKGEHILCKFCKTKISLVNGK